MKNSALLLAYCMLLGQGCATPSERFSAKADRLHFSRQLLDASRFQHRLYLNAQADQPATVKELHVYLDGDGTPWRSDNRKAGDPTSRSGFILDLMAKDPSAALLLGRPCYYGLNTSTPCNDELWTSQRYSAAVVESMSGALGQWLSSRHVEKLVLIGYSGGGVLATLLAAKLENVSAIMTVAANLDVEAWSAQHGYPGLSGSLNPAREVRIPAGVRQIHLAGLLDDNVPASIIEAFSRSQANSRYIPMPGYDHVCCWLENWPAILLFL